MNSNKFLRFTALGTPYIVSTDVDSLDPESLASYKEAVKYITSRPQMSEPCLPPRD